MSIIKVSTSIFSTIKTVEKALMKASKNDEIQLSSAIYNETLTIQQNVIINGKNRYDTILEGTIIIPKDVEVHFQEITIKPSTHIHVEGTANFSNCLFDGSETNAILSIGRGYVDITNCLLENAKDVAIVAFDESQLRIENTTFTNNGKTHLLLENTTLELISCELTHSQHALWLKNDCIATSKYNIIRQQKGTQCIVQQSRFYDEGSEILKSEGNGIYASKESLVVLKDTLIQKHQLPQIWLQNSQIEGRRVFISNGNECGIMVSEQSSADFVLSTIHDHKISNIQIMDDSRSNFEHCQIHSCDGIGIQVKTNSIANFNKTTIANHTLAQLFVSDQSIISMNETDIKKGKQVGIIAEKNSNCSILNSTIKEHANSGITIVDSELMVAETKIEQNGGNGVLTIASGKLFVDQCYFSENKMPHIGGKNKAIIQLTNSQFTNGKSIYIIDRSQITVENCQFHHSSGVQIEIDEMSKAKITKSKIQHGQTNAIKVQKDSSLFIYQSQISHHRLPQVVLNDSSLMMDNCEVLQGERNGFIIEHHSEANIIDTFISRHAYPQLWVDQESIVELANVQITDGAESDLYVQNNSKLFAENCVIKNDKFQYNIQAVHHSVIILENTYVENQMGEIFFEENNSKISSNFDEVSE